MKRLAIALLIAGNAHAATTQLNINGTVSTSCAFTGTTSGVLAVSPNTPNIMSTGAVGGSAGTASVSFTGTPTLTVTEITGFDSVPSGYNPTFSVSNTVSSGLLGALSFSSGVASGVYSSGNSDTVTVTLGVASSAPYITGNYTAHSTLTCQ